MSKKNIENLKTGVIIGLVLVIIFGASYFASELKNCKGTSSKTDATDTNSGTNETSNLTDIGIDSYLSLKEGSDKAIIYIARPTCHYCEEQKPIMTGLVSEYGITVNYLNTDELSEEDQAKLIKSDDYFSEGFGTPLTLIVQNDEIIDKKEGLTDKESLVSLFKEHGFISE